MLDTLKKIAKMPGELRGINLFDAIYSGITVGMIGALGTGAKILGNVGINLNKRWSPGEKLEILLLAYSGARNTGAEVRVGECIRQLNLILGEENIVINMTTLNLAEAEEYFKGYKVSLKPLNAIFFGDVFRYVLENHVVVLVEGSCWKENFASALLLYFLYGSGLAATLNKASFSYAVDAGKMNRLNNTLSYLFSRKMSRIITRSEESSERLEKLGLPTHSTRVDTAWTMDVESNAWAKRELKRLGWNGKKPLVGLAMQNYFWWPVVPDSYRWAKTMLGGEDEYQYKMIYFYDYPEEDKRRYEEFAATLAEQMDWIAETYDAQIVVVGMEGLDQRACEDTERLMNNKPILFTCNSYVGTEIGAMLRNLRLLITTRYHAMLLSMPGKAPFIGLSRDERIRGVMKETGLYDKYYLDYREPDLGDRLRRMVAELMEEDEKDRVRSVIREHLPYYFAQMGMLGLDIRRMVMEQFPSFPLKRLDENQLMELIPNCPEELKEEAQSKYLELKAAEQGSSALRPCDGTV